MIDLVERLVVVAAVHPVGDGEVLAGVNVVEGDRPRLGVRGGAAQAAEAKKHEERGDAAIGARPGGTQGQSIRVRGSDRHVPTQPVAPGPHVRGERRGRQLRYSPRVTATTTSDALPIREGLTRLSRRTRPPRCRKRDRRLWQKLAPVNRTVKNSLTARRRARRGSRASRGSISA